MTDIALYFAPETCARVTMTALETIGRDYEVRLIRFRKGQHRAPDYLSLNPKGKVPTLVFNGEPLTENVAILTFLDRTFPDARLLPPTDDELGRARQLADLCFCAATLHPIVTRIRLPMLFVEGDEAVRNVYERAVAAMRPNFDIVEQRLESAEWWYGDAWSIMDAYIHWAWFRVIGAGFPAEEYLHMGRHSKRMEDLPQVQRMLARERQAAEQLKVEGLEFVPPPIPGAKPT